MQVFGGIAFTAEHPAHRYLRRIVVREQQFGDAAHHERALGRGARRPRAVPEPRRPDDARRRARRFNDPTAQRLEAITTGAEPEVVGPLLAEALHDPRWQRCDVALISGGKSNLTYRVACDAGEVVLRRPPLGHILPTAHDMVREHRVLRALEGTAVPVPRVLHLGGADGPLGAPFYVMERVARARLPQRAAAGLRRRAASSARRSARRSSTCSPTCTRVDPAAVGLADFGRPAGFMERQLRRWSQAVGAPRSRASSRRSTRCATSSCATLPAAARGGDRPRRLPARQHGAAPDRARPHRRGARLGDEHARRPVRPTSARCWPTGARPATTRVLRRGADRPAGDGGRGLPDARRGRRALRAAHGLRRHATSTGTRRSRSSSSRSSARASPRAPPAARCSARASTRRSASSRRWSTRPALGTRQRVAPGRGAVGAVGGSGGRGHRIAIPPSTLSTWPVTKLPPAPSRNSTASSSSPARPPRPQRRARRAGTPGTPPGRRPARRSSPRRRSRAPAR